MLFTKQQRTIPSIFKNRTKCDVKMELAFLELTIRNTVFNREGEREGTRNGSGFIGTKKLTVNSWPEEFLAHGIHWCNVVWLHIAILNRSNWWWPPSRIFPEQTTSLYTIIMIIFLNTVPYFHATLIKIMSLRDNTQ